MRRGIAIMFCKDFHYHGYVKIKELENGGSLFKVNISGLPEGKHGFHVHSSGNIVHGGESVCNHFNPMNKDHGDLNDINSHIGDMGNIIFDNSETCEMSFVSKYIQLHGDNSIIGRSLIVHSHEDDLGLGNNEESKKNGNSGGRILFGIVGINQKCES